MQKLYLNKMNNKGQISSLGFSILIAVLIFAAGMIIMNFIKPEITNARTDLSCSTPSIISDGTKATCLIIDGVIPYFILIVISAAGGLITSKFLV